MRFHTLDNNHVALYVLLIAGDQVMGIVTLESDRPDIVVAARSVYDRINCGQGCFAVQNAKLYTTIHSNAAELNTLYNATSVLFQADNVRQMAEQVVKAITLEFSQSDCGLIMVDYIKMRWCGWLVQANIRCAPTRRILSGSTEPRDRSCQKWQSGVRGGCQSEPALSR